MQYDVKYNITVQSQDAVAAVNRFVEAAQKLAGLTGLMNEASQSVNGMAAVMSQLNGKTFSLKVDVSKAKKDLGSIAASLQTIESMTASMMKQTSPMAGMRRELTSLQSSMIQRWTGALNRLTGKQGAASVGGVSQQITALGGSIDALNKKVIKPTAQVDGAINELQRLQNKLNDLKGMSSIKITASASGTRNAAGAAPAKPAAPQTAPLRPAAPATQPWFRRAFSYVPNAHATLGNVYAGTGANMAAEMVKGLGVAYGISALMSGVKSVFTDAAAYDNVTKTTQNILATKEVDLGFMSRFDEMNRLMRRVGMETKFTAPQVAEAGKFLAMAGMNTAQIMQSIRPIADIALIGDTDLGETADVVTNIMTAYQIPAEKMDRVADIMTNTFTSANVTLMDMAQSFQYSASLFRKAGVPFEVAAASLGVLGDAGIKGSQAGTTMRTILANIYRPTGKQEEAWAAVGVKRTDESGKVRPITDIFADLQAKNIDIQSAYGLFHKTAAQGAVALIGAVDKWNSIITNNFLSESLARKLAYEKTRTVQGMWAQITSAFTETGMQNFEALQQPVRELLDRVLAIMKSPEFSATLGYTMRMAMEALVPIGQGFQFAINTFKQANDLLGGSLTGFLKFQMYVTMINKAQIALISLAKGVKALYSVGIVRMAGGALADMTGAAARAIYVKTLSEAQLQKLRAAAVVGQPSPITWGKMIGRALMNPWIALAGSVVSVGALVWRQWGRMAEAAEQYRNKVVMVNGINMTEHASQMDRYLALTTNRQRTLNQQVEEYIRLRKEEMGLVPPDEQDSSVSFKNSRLNDWEDTMVGWVEGLLPFSSNIGVEKAMGRVKLITDQYFPEGSPFHMQAPLTGMETKAGQAPKYMGYFFGKEYELNSNSGVNKFNADLMMYEAGASKAKGSEAANVIDEYTSKMLQAVSVKDWNALNVSLKNRVQEIAGRADSTLMSASALVMGDWTPKTWKNYPLYVEGTVNRITEAMDWINPITASAKALKTYYDILRLKEHQMAVPVAKIQELLAGIGYVEFAPKLGQWDNGAWAQAYAGYNGRDDVTNPEMREKILIAWKDLNTARQQLPLLAEEIGGMMDSPVMKFRTVASVSGNGEPMPLTPEELANLGKNQGGQDSLLPFPSASTGEEDYKSRYSTSSAPKQVIVNIQSLMKVDTMNIDMNDGRQVAAMNSIREELATALLDVVQDFNANMGTI